MDPDPFRADAVPDPGHERPVTRRAVLRSLGVLGLGSVAVACSAGGDGTASPATGGAPAGGATGSGAGTAATGASTGASTGGSTVGSVLGFEDAASCTESAALMEGPYYLDLDTLRSDIREDRPGARLDLAVRILDADGCRPIENALVEIWHCDAEGIYSGFEAQSRDANGRSSTESTTADTTTYLRGGVLTGADGVAAFTTIYPGWYAGRAVHVHLKTFVSSREVITSQLFFDDDVSATVYAGAAYRGHGEQDTRNEADGIFLSGGANSPVVRASRQGDAYAGLVTVNVSRA